MQTVVRALCLLGAVAAVTAAARHEAEPCGANETVLVGGIVTIICTGECDGPGLQGPCEARLVNVKHFEGETFYEYECTCLDEGGDPVVTGTTCPAVLRIRDSNGDRGSGCDLTIHCPDPQICTDPYPFNHEARKCCDL